MKNIRILIALDFNSQDNNNFFNCLKKSSIKFDFNEFKKKKTLNNLENNLEKIILKNKITHIIIQSFLWFDYEILKNLKEKYNLNLILLSGDCNYLYKSLNFYIGGIFDLILTVEKRFEYKYQKHGIKSKFFIFPLSVDFRKNVKKIYDVSFVGNTKRKHKREYYLNHLDILKNKYKLKIITNKFINQKDLLKIIRQSKISLNFTGRTNYSWTNFFSDSKNTFKSRALDIISQKTFCLSEHDYSTKKLIKSGNGIIYFNNEIELISKIKYYLQNEDRINLVIKNFKSSFLRKYNKNEFIKTILKILKKTRKRKKLILKDSLFLKLFRFIYYVKRLIQFNSFGEFCYLNKKIITNFLK